MNSDCSVREIKGENRPFIPELERALTLLSLEAVDVVCIYDERRCTRLIYAVEPDIYVKGGDVSIEAMDRGELKALRDCRSSILFVPRYGGLSTSGLIQKRNELTPPSS